MSKPLYNRKKLAQKPRKVIPIEEVYSRKGKKVDWAMIGKTLLRPTSKDKKLVMMHPDFHGIFYSAPEIRERALKLLRRQPQFKLWDANRRKLAGRYLTTDQIKEFETLHERANNRGKSFWWDARLNKKGSTQIIFSYDTMPNSPNSPRRIATLTLNKDSVGVESEWDHESERVADFHRGLMATQVGKSEVALTGVLEHQRIPFGSRPAKTTVRRTVNSVLDHFSDLIEHFE